MTSEPEATAATDPSSARQRDLVALLIALVVAVVLARIVSSLTLRGAVPGPVLQVLQVLLGNVAVWVPLVFGIIWVVRRTGRDLFGRFRIELGDLVFALGIVILTRVFDAVLALSFTGTTGLQPAPTLGTPDIGLLLVSGVGIVLVSPVLEELFFRGLFQRLLAAELTPRTRWLAVLVTAFLFALAHLFLGSATTTLGGFQVFSTTFVLGLLTGTLVAITNRVGGAIVAHVLFNAVAVVATWPR
ncbi:CPBP family intramembrane glutamic endopeptidase [Curtobacterium sp. MCSS17_008]|uniref:CPBP family intramembrane glutamic endopeptidase n=1 Tax=Curtobacterium sp. MCSS17_008 TaxID=2175647 RepID=UPI0015E8B479|nr:type II CAAX endopeptidase family protein [Curtobacterium sp. MCSS17_008]